MFIKKVELDDKIFVYDVNINQIVTVDNAIADVLFTEPTVDHPVSPELSEKCISAKNQTALKEIEQYKKSHNLFTDYTPRKVTLPSRAQLKDIFENHIHHAILNVTNQCNLRCKYCSYGDKYPHERDHHSMNMSWETARLALDLVFENSSGAKDIAIGFYGGEPLLNFDVIVSSVQYAKKRAADLKKPIRFSMTTNGTLLTKSIIEFLVDEEFNLLFSLDGPRHMHDRNRVDRNGNGTWDTVSKTILQIKTDYPDFFIKNVGYSSMITPPFDLAATREFFTQSEFALPGPIKLNLPNMDGTTFYNDFTDSIWTEFSHQKRVQDDLLCETLSVRERPDNFQVAFIIDELYSAFHRRFTGANEFMPLNGCCVPGHQRTFISSDGNIGPCEKIGDRLILGNVSDGFDIEKIYTIMKQYGEACDVCSSCWINRNCSLCFLSMMKPTETGEWEMVNEQKIKACERKLRHSTTTLKRYLRVLSLNPKIFDTFVDKNYFDDLNRIEDAV